MDPEVEAVSRKSWEGEAWTSVTDTIAIGNYLDAQDAAPLATRYRSSLSLRTH